MLALLDHSNIVGKRLGRNIFGGDCQRACCDMRSSGTGLRPYTFFLEWHQMLLTLRFVDEACTACPQAPTLRLMPYLQRYLIHDRGLNLHQIVEDVASRNTAIARGV